MKNVRIPLSVISLFTQYPSHVTSKRFLKIQDLGRYEECEDYFWISIFWTSISQPLSIISLFK